MLNNCNWDFDQFAEAHLINVVLLDHQLLDLDLYLSFLTFCRKLCLLSVQTPPARREAWKEIKETIDENTVLLKEKKQFNHEE